MPKFAMTREEHTRAVIEALEKTHQRNMQSKEAALKFLRDAGIILEDEPQPKVKIKTKKAK
jgi:hypothetical protein